MVIKQLNNGSLLFFTVIIIALIVHWVTTKDYDVSKNEALEEVSSTKGIISYVEIHNYIVSDKLDDLILIDIRDRDSFENEHIEGSFNIPLDEIFSSEAKKKFKKNKTKAIIGDNESEAQIARLSLLGKGYEDIFVLPGGYKFAKKHLFENFNPAYGYYSADKAGYDYIKFINVGNKGKQDDTSKPVIPEVEIETITVEGGC